MMDGTVLDPSDARARDFAYAEYFSDANTIVSRKGYYSGAANKVCGYESEVGMTVCMNGSVSTGKSCETTNDCGAGETCGPGKRTVRFVRGGSCTACGGNEGVCTDPTIGNASERSCTILGGVCLDEGSAIYNSCTDGNPDTSCPIDQLRRCVTAKDCPALSDGTKLECIDDPPIVVQCTGCLAGFEAAWKYRDAGKAEKGRTRLTDLTTNPEEKNGNLECYDSSCTSGSICDAQGDLKGYLNAWRKCVEKSACDDQICEDLSAVPACALPSP